MSRARLLAQLGWVCYSDAAALRHEYELDSQGRPVQPTTEEAEQAEYLSTIGDRYFDKADELEPGKPWGTNGAFG